jgi:protein O-GlcNAc transferase
MVKNQYAGRRSKFFQDFMMSILQAFRMAWDHFKAGRLPQADQLCRQIVQADTGHFGALHLLGLIASRTGRNDLAIDDFKAALRLNPDFAEAHTDLAIELATQRKLAEAVDSFRQALRVDPDHVRAHFGLGVSLQFQGKLDEAAASFQRTVQLQPDHAQAHCHLGYALLHQGQPAVAVDSLQQALRLKSDYPEALHSLGTALMSLGRLEEAVNHFQQALRIRPNYSAALIELGNAFKVQERLEEAATTFRQAVRVRPDHAEAYNNLGNALRELGQFEEADASLREALRLKPDYAEAAYNLGVALWSQGRLEEAVLSYRQAIGLKPDYAAAHSNLGICLTSQGQLDDAIAAFRTALELNPADANAHSNLILTLNYHPGYDQRAIWEECRHWNQRHAEPLRRAIQPHANLPDPDRRLRVGYLSLYFRDHLESCLTLPLLANHDHRQFEIFCYAQVARFDTSAGRLRDYADVCRSIVGLSHGQTADLVRKDQIDILVDLRMHTADNRLLVFARKPAPVQVSWLGYPGTTGLSTIDYRLTDPYLDPPGLFDAFYSEESLRLPDTFWCYDPLTTEPSVHGLPALESGVVTFGCLNNFCKINDGCLALWAQVLRAVPRSRLVLLAPRGPARDRVLSRLYQEGIAGARVVFADKRPRPEYLKLYHQIDLGLDPLPYNGHTTSLDAFWMGVPTLTMLGKTVVGRAGWSLLCNLKLNELAAETSEEYVALTAQLAGDLPRLQHLRGTLRQRLSRSPLMDGRRFAGNVERVYRQIWRGWCQGLLPAPTHEPV